MAGSEVRKDEQALRVSFVAGEQRGLGGNAIKLSVNPESLCTCDQFRWGNRDEHRYVHAIAKAKNPQILAIWSKLNINVMSELSGVRKMQAI